MENKKKIPIKMEHNRVWRIYAGGKLLDEFCGAAEGKDSAFPEDWLASVVEANNMPREGKPEREGLSFCADGVYLKDKIMENPERLLGEKHLAQFGDNLGVLVKFLDSAVRLPIQVHPDKAAAKALFSSDYGKTESWYILGGREINGEKPHIYLGFKEGVTRKFWRKCFETQDIAEMEKVLHKFYVEPGDVYLIRGGTPHAIGAGCFLLEVQEPTDYTISVEKLTPDGNPVPDFLCHQGLGFERMFECFHYEPASAEETKASCKLEPYIREKTAGAEVYGVIDSTHTDAFSLNRICVKTRYCYPNKEQASILAVAEGEGTLQCGEEVLSLRQGDTVFMPAGVEDVVFTTESGITLLDCMPPSVSK